MANSSRAILLGVLIVLSLIYTGGCRHAGRWLAREDLPPHADAMVILMGNIPDRVLQAADLWREVRADRIIIVEESMGPFESLTERGVKIISNSQQAGNALVTLGIPSDSLTILSGNARSTIEEARVVRDFISQKRSCDTILLVSSAPHMRRASMIFRNAFRENEVPVFIGSSPSAYSSFNPDRWWRRKEDIQSVLSELAKIGSFIMVEKRQMRDDLDAVNRNK